VNLASTTHIDFHTFVTIMFTRISADNVDGFLRTLSSMPPSLPVLRFKISILHKLLGSKTPSTNSGRPKPQARAKPRPARRNGGSHQEQTSAEPVISSSRSIVANPLLPAFSEISRAMESSSHHFSDSDMSPASVKAELWLAYGQYQQQIQPETRDREWLAFLGNGDWGQLLDNSLPSTAVNDNYREVLNAFLISWKESS